MDSGRLQAAAGIAQAPVISLPFSGVEKNEVEKSVRKSSPEIASMSRSKASRMAFGSAGGAAAAPMAESLAEPAAPKAKADRPAGPSVETARSAEELKRLWERLGTAGTPPAVDFETEMVVAVSAPSPVEIVKVWTSGRRMVVEYRPLPDGERPGSAFRVVPLSDLPPSLQLVK